MILKLEFTYFAVLCPGDYITITDGDGTTLMDKRCGSSSTDPSDSEYFLPPSITSRTNRVEIFFFTNSGGSTTGWSLSWAAVTPGPNIPILIVSNF